MESQAIAKGMLEMCRGNKWRESLVVSARGSSSKGTEVMNASTKLIFLEVDIHIIWTLSSIQL